MNFFIIFYDKISMCIICRGEYKGETDLDCSGCTSLTSLPELPNLTTLECCGCTSLTSLPDMPNVTSLDCGGCTWLNHSSNYKYHINISRLSRLQRWYRRMIWCRYLASKEFIEWCYAPDNIGGKQAKRDILRNIN